MYFERDVGGEIQLIFIDHMHSQGDLYMVATSADGLLVIEEGYIHGRDADAVIAFETAYGLERRRK